ncbi:hypothetical protein [Bacteroides sp.]|uniref:tetratricopeptide repeat protein n=1 Tax=Bacteroides sp. TaxID=29523 RepID=UPI0026220F51|nr:hypothetical protein [Bacteroides sp.]MDD3036662.1 hypothetical protein [Bacteroides sp.]
MFDILFYFDEDDYRKVNPEEDGNSIVHVIKKRFDDVATFHYTTNQDKDGALVAKLQMTDVVVVYLSDNLFNPSDVKALQVIVENDENYQYWVLPILVSEISRVTRKRIPGQIWEYNICPDNTHPLSGFKDSVYEKECICIIELIDSFLTELKTEEDLYKQINDNENQTRLKLCESYLSNSKYRKHREQVSKQKEDIKKEIEKENAWSDAERKGTIPAYLNYIKMVTRKGGKDNDNKVTLAKERIRDLEKKVVDLYQSKPENDNRKLCELIHKIGEIHSEGDSYNNLCREVLRYMEVRLAAIKGKETELNLKEILEEFPLDISKPLSKELKKLIESIKQDLKQIEEKHINELRTEYNDLLILAKVKRETYGLITFLERNPDCPFRMEVEEDIRVLTPREGIHKRIGHFVGKYYVSILIILFTVGTGGYFLARSFWINPRYYDPLPQITLNIDTIVNHSTIRYLMSVDESNVFRYYWSDTPLALGGDEWIRDALKAENNEELKLINRSLSQKENGKAYYLLARRYQYNEDSVAFYMNKALTFHEPYAEFCMIMKPYKDLPYVDYNSVEVMELVKQLELLAQKNIPEAALVLGNYYYVKKQQDKAEKLYEKAAEGGHHKGCWNLGFLCLEQKDTLNALDYFHKAFEINKKEESHGYTLVKLLLSGNRTLSKDSLAFHTLSRLGVTPNSMDRYKDWYHLLLATMHLQGVGTARKDTVEALRYMRQVNTVEGLYNAGYMTLHGWGREPDKKEAFRLFNAAIEKGVKKDDIDFRKKVLYAISCCIDASENDLNKTLMHLNEGMKMGCRKCANKLGIFYSSEKYFDVQKSIECFEFSMTSDKDNPASEFGCYNLGSLYYYGLWRTPFKRFPHNKRKGEELLKKMDDQDLANLVLSNDKWWNKYDGWLW